MHQGMKGIVCLKEKTGTMYMFVFKNPKLVLNEFFIFLFYFLLVHLSL